MTKNTNFYNNSYKSLSNSLYSLSKPRILFYKIKCEYFQYFYINYKEAPITFLSKRKQKFWRGRNINSLNTFMVSGGKRLNIDANQVLEFVQD